MEKQNEQKEILNKRIFWFYEWGLKFIPIFLMLCHWYGVFDFHSNPREILICIKENESCIAFLYGMTYVFPLLFMIPASYFYKLCWVFRIPFLYVIGVNMIRIYYGSFIITNEMKDIDYILILFIIAIYLYVFIVKCFSSIGSCKSSKIIPLHQTYNQ